VFYVCFSLLLLSCREVGQLLAVRLMLVYLYDWIQKFKENGNIKQQKLQFLLSPEVDPLVNILPCIHPPTADGSEVNVLLKFSYSGSM